MKKYTIVVLLTVLLFSFCSCGKTADGELSTLPFEESRSDVSDVWEAQEVSGEVSEPNTEERTREKQTAPGTENRAETTSADTRNTEMTTEKPMAETTQVPATAKPVASTTEKKSDTVTILISCETILENRENLKKGKESFVPPDGIILSRTEVSIEDGDTVFDVLKKVCRENNIQIEYSYSGAFGTYYIEGIHQLYEKDCGTRSGWLYCVNGDYPSVGCSSYTLHFGDEIQFVYTCG